MPFLVAIVDPAKGNKYDIKQTVHIWNILWSCKQEQSIQCYKRNQQEPHDVPRSTE
jgi:hypothetical protein